ncbi:MAG: cytochrome c [Roseovarius sp.]
MRIGRHAGVVALTALIIAQGAQADGVAKRGGETFLRYCASCHGVEGDGMGPMRPVLMVPPADLTALAETNGGVFPLERVLARIDGRDALVSHGSEMPVYGDFFSSGGRATVETEDGETVRTTGALADLVAYLRLLQAE